MRSIVLLIVFFIAGCNSSDIPKPVPKTASNDRLFDTQRRALGQAKQISQQMEQQAEVQRKAIEQQTHE
jgi:hypothetical protein